MDVTETTGVPDAALPIAGFRAHLRLGTGFADEASSDGALAAYLRAAIAVIEGRTGKALLARGFRLVLAGWRWPDTQALPVAPVSAVEGMAMRSRTGARARWRRGAGGWWWIGTARALPRPARFCPPSRWTGRLRSISPRALARTGMRCRMIWRRRCSCWPRITMRGAPGRVKNCRSRWRR